MDAELKKLRQNDLGDDEVISLSENFWETAQAIIEDLVDEYIAEDGSISSLVMQKSNTSTAEKIILFRFDASACALTTQSGKTIKQVSFIPLIIKIMFKNLSIARRKSSKKDRTDFSAFYSNYFQSAIFHFSASISDMPFFIVEHYRPLSTT